MATFSDARQSFWVVILSHTSRVPRSGENRPAAHAAHTQSSVVLFVPRLVYWSRPHSRGRALAMHRALSDTPGLYCPLAQGTHPASSSVALVYALTWVPAGHGVCSGSLNRHADPCVRDSLAPPAL